MVLDKMVRIAGIELRRKLFHIISGSVIAALLFSGWIAAIHLTILFAALVLLFLIYPHWKLPVLHEMLCAMEREENMKSSPGIGASFFVLGMALAAWLFPPATAAAAVLILAWGDSIAALIGPYGNISYLNPKKTWEGILAGILAATLAASFAVPFTIALAASSVAMLLEGLDLKLGSWKIDDNLLIPLAAGTVMLVGQIL